MLLHPRQPAQSKEAGKNACADALILPASSVYVEQRAATLKAWTL